MQDYGDYREAAREAIHEAGGEPVLIEDQPSLSTTPRTACLDLVATCDALVCLVGPRGGYLAPSGKLVVEEEFDEARRRGMPSLVFLQETERDSSAEALATSLSDYVGGRYRSSFDSAEQLRSEILRALRPLLQNMTHRPLDPQIVQQLLEEDADGDMGDSATSLRVVVGPTVDTEVVDPLRLASENFSKSVNRLAHERDVFSYAYGKKGSPTSSSLTILQVPNQRRDRRHARIHLATSGLILVESQVTGLRAGEEDFGFSTGNLSSSYEIVFADLHSRALSILQFLNDLLGSIDPHGRYSSWFLNAALVNVGHRRVVDTPARSNSASVSMFTPPEIITARDEPRKVDRHLISQPQEEANRLSMLLRMRLDEHHSYS